MTENHDEQTGDMNLAAFGESVRWHRQGEGLTQAQLGQRMADAGFPWHTSTVSKTESGQRDATVSELLELARIFDVPPTALVSLPITMLHLERSLRNDVDRTRAEAEGYETRADEAASRIAQQREQIADLQRLIAEAESLIDTDLTLEAAYRQRAQELRQQVLVAVL